MEILRDLGFTEREIKVYLGLIELGSTTVGPIATKTKIQHGKIYETIDKLMQKGLVSYTLIGKTKHFIASDPKEILNIFDEKRYIFEKTLKELQLKKSLSKSKQVSIVHEGFKTIKSLFNSIVDNLTKEDYYYYFSSKTDYGFFSPSLFLKTIHLQLEEKKVDNKMLSALNSKKLVEKSFKETKIKRRYVNLDLPQGIVIIPGKVISLLWDKIPTAIEINSFQFQEHYFNFFINLWETSKK